MSISNISATHTVNKETPATPNRTTEIESFDHIMQEEMTILSFSQTPPLSADTSLSQLEESESLEIDHDRHIDAFIHHALAHAPESEKKIWARMKDELGIQ